MIDSSRIINVDYIGTVCYENGKYIVKYVSIPRSIESLNCLKACYQEETSTRQDLQNLFTSFFPEQVNFNYCYPLDYYYRSDGVDPSGFYPISFTQKDYDAVVARKRKELIEKDPAIKDEALTIQQAEFRDLLKNAYYQQCTKYIRAYDYAHLLEKLKRDSSIKVYSTEETGYMGPNSYQKCQLGNDVVLSISTNFAYGQASQFILNLTYKGIPIYLYSKYVKYYFAERVDIIECTDSYYPRRENWEIALRFIEKVANLVAYSTSAFVGEYLWDELAVFMDGIRKLYKDPKSFLGQIVGLSSFRQRTSPYVNIRHIKADEFYRFKTYPHEMGVSFRLDKLTGALEFLETLSKLEDVYPWVKNYVNEIKTINKSIESDIVKSIEECDLDLARLKNQKEELNNQLFALKERKNSLNDELSSLLDNAEESENKVIEEEYRFKHPELSQLPSRIYELEIAICKLKEDLKFREQYRSWLTNDLDRVAKYV